MLKNSALIVSRKLSLPLFIAFCDNKRSMRLFLLAWAIFALIGLASAGEFSGISLGAGFINQHIGEFQVDTEGKKNRFRHEDHRAFFAIEGAYTFDQKKRWDLLAAGGFVWPGGNRHSYISKNHYFFNGLAGFKFHRRWQARLGLGLFVTSIKGDGGLDRLDSGGEPTNFPIPAGRKNSINSTTVMGISYIPSSKWSLKMEGFIFNLLLPYKRSFSYTLSWNYHFGVGWWE